MKRIMMAVALAGMTSGGVALAQQEPPGRGQSGAQIDTKSSDTTSQTDTAVPENPSAPVYPPGSDTQPGTSMSGQETTAPDMTAPPAPPTTYVPDQSGMQATALPPSEPMAPIHHEPNPVGITVAGSAGIQAFSGQLADSLRAGPAWGASAIIHPRIPVGLELRYEGASNQLFGSGNFWNGPRQARVVQNDGQVLANVGLTRNAARVQPFVAGGVGMGWYSLSNPVNGYADDSLGQVPLGAGVNFHVRPADSAGAVTVGLRGDYTVLFSDQFAPTNTVTDYGLFTKQGGDQYRGELTLGGSF